MSVCANCGKGEEASINLKACTACKLVKYCSRDCQIAHRPQHKKACKRRAKELHDEKIFKQPPPLEDCPICFQRLPSLATGRTYMACCGKMICRGCVHAFQLRVVLAGKKEEDQKCPFCRTPAPTTDKEWVEKLNKRIEINDAEAFHDMGFCCSRGDGLPQNQAKALELWHRAGELGNTSSYSCIGHIYESGDGVERDKKQAIKYFELAAMGGNVVARHNLGSMEGQKGNHDMALKHYLIAVKDGSGRSLEIIKLMYKNGDATKEDYTKALRSYQAYLAEVKSDQRDEAAAFSDEYKYYDSAV